MTAALALALLAVAPPAAGPAGFAAGDTTVSVRFGDAPRLVWHAAVTPGRGDYTPLPKPFVFPLYAPGGVNVLDYAPADHPHHKGLWIAVDEVENPDRPGIDATENGPFKHWVEDGLIATEAYDPAAVGPPPAAAGAPPRTDAVRWRFENDWLRPGTNSGDPESAVLREETTVTAYADGLTTFDITLRPAEDIGTPVNTVIHDTKEGFLGLRVAPWMTEKSGNGRIENSEGNVGEADSWGIQAHWCDYSATAPGTGETVGLALFDHPGNVREARYHVRGYGLMAVSPFGPHAYTKGEQPEDPVTIPADGLRLRYAVYVHAGDANTGGVAAAYQRYAGAE